MALKPEVSIGVGLATAVLVWSIYSGALPPLADVRTNDADDLDVQAAERMATWTAAGTVAGISLIAKDPTVFTIGGAMVVILAWWNRHADAVDPQTGQAFREMHSPDESTMDEMAEAS